MRAQPDEIEAFIIRLAIDQDQVGSDVTVAVIVSLAAERMVEILPR
jgi:hypothetical protein